MSRMSGIEISSSQGLKKPPKMSPREEKDYLPRAAGPREVSFFFPRAYFKVFYNPRDEEISIPDINGHSENLFLFEFIYVQNLFFFREIVMRTIIRNGFTEKKIVKALRLDIRKESERILVDSQN